MTRSDEQPANRHNGFWPRPVTDAKPWQPAAREAAQPERDSEEICWCCSGATVKRHCKIVCTNCGFMRDCSDP